jgi:predicted outer membrane lipoprotein
MVGGLALILAPVFGVLFAATALLLLHIRSRRRGREA